MYRSMYIIYTNTIIGNQNSMEYLQSSVHSAWAKSYLDPSSLTTKSRFRINLKIALILESLPYTMLPALISISNDYYVFVLHPISENELQRPIMSYNNPVNQRHKCI